MLTALLVTASRLCVHRNIPGLSGHSQCSVYGAYASEWRLIWQQLLALLWQELTSGTNCLSLSGDTNLAAMAAQMDLYEHIAHLLYTTLPSL